MCPKPAIDDITCAWTSDAGSNDSIAISSRVRLARNLENLPFPHNLDSKNGAQILAWVQKALSQSEAQFVYEKNVDISKLALQILVEKHLISPQHAQNTSGQSAVAVSQKGALSIMVNEEDHLRVQCLLSGAHLQDCWKQVSQLDDELEQQLDLAFNENLGYLTACPTNVGTGLRASVMLHLPALVYTNNIGNVLSAMAQVGLVVRGLYGEGTEAHGNMFQISNQVTLGLSEEELIENLEDVAQQIVDRERQAREYLMSEHRIDLEDRVGRANGILNGAHKISAKESMQLLSEVRLGADLGLLKQISPAVFNELMVLIQAGSLQKLVREKLEPQSRDVIRARVLRERIKRN